LGWYDGDKNPAAAAAADDDDDVNDIVVVEMLDGTEITDTTRQFLRSWQANRDAIKQRLQSNSDATCRQPTEGKSDSICRNTMIHR